MTGQTGTMHRLICIFTGCTCYFVGFVMLWRVCDIHPHQCLCGVGGYAQYIVLNEKLQATMYMVHFS